MNRSGAFLIGLSSLNLWHIYGIYRDTVINGGKSPADFSYREVISGVLRIRQ